MYQPTEISQLSSNQISRLLNGHPVRVKAGKGQVLSLSMEQSKKLSKASKKGSGLNLTFDPYQIDQHSSMKGTGIKKAFKKLGSFVKGNKEAFRPLASSLKTAGNEMIALKAMEALDAGVDPALVSAYANMSSQALTGPRGNGIIKKIGKLVKSPAAKTVRKAFRPLAQQAFENAMMVAESGLDQATQQAMQSTGGSGIIKKIGKLAKSPAIKTVRKAFRPLAQQAFENAMMVAESGLDQATQQAMQSTGGSGFNREDDYLAKIGKIRTRLSRSGGALMPAGYGYR